MKFLSKAMLLSLAIGSGLFFNIVNAEEVTDNILNSKREISTTNNINAVDKKISEIQIAYSAINLNNKPVFVIGHKSPDSDTVCTAISFAYLLNQLGIKAQAVLSGKPNNETLLILKKFGIEVPNILEDASDKNIVLVDHSDFSQSVSGMENAQIVEIIDHHALGTVTTKAPMIAKFLPVGSASTIAFYEFERENIAIPQNIAGVLLGAILSDTRNLAFTTTTELDRIAVKKLTTLAKVENVKDFYAQMVDAASSYDGKTDEEIFNSDYKLFNMGSKNVGIAQVNTKNSTVSELTTRMQNTAPLMLENKNLDMVFVMLSNIDTKMTEMICFGEGAKDVCQKSFINENDKFYINGLGSRKKDVVPKLKSFIK